MRVLVHSGRRGLTRNRQYQEKPGEASQSIRIHDRGMGHLKFHRARAYTVFHKVGLRGYCMLERGAECKSPPPRRGERKYESMERAPDQI